MILNLQELNNIKNIYISSDEFCKTTKQSCDCVSLIADTGKKLIAMKFCKTEYSCIGIFEITEFDNEEYKYKLLIKDEPITLKKINYDDNGILIDALKFKFKDAFLFVFADEYNLILTKSKYDRLDDVGDIITEEAESTLEIVMNV